MPQASTFNTLSDVDANSIAQLDLPDGVTKNVYLMRGLPGSGKSYLASAIVLHAIQQALAMNGSVEPNVARVCSERDHFVGGDGKYRLSMKNFSEAQQSCLANLSEAVTLGVRTICIHHIYPSLQQYTHYLKVVHDNGYRVQVVEIYCPTEEAVGLFYERQRKSLQDNYSLEECLNMWQAWEVDPEAVYVSPTWQASQPSTQPKQQQPAQAQAQVQAQAQAQAQAQPRAPATRGQSQASSQNFGKQQSSGGRYPQQERKSHTQQQQQLHQESKRKLYHQQTAHSRENSTSPPGSNPSSRGNSPPFNPTTHHYKQQQHSRYRNDLPPRHAVRHQKPRHVYRQHGRRW